jgi:hypothetical protein
MRLRRLRAVLVSVLGSVMAALLLAGCSGGLHAIQHAAFPPGTEQHLDDWEYLLTVDVATDTSFVEQSEKTVLITVEDAEGDRLLEDEFVFNCGLVDNEVLWDEFDTIFVDLLAVGAEGEEDPFNEKLLEHGPLPLAELEYEYDEEAHRFVRVAGP